MSSVSLTGPAGGSMLRLDSIRACIAELRAVAESHVHERDTLQLLLQKVDNLEDCIFDTDEWEQVDGEPVLKIAVLGMPSCGQHELLNRFLCGSSDGEGHRHKTPLELITGIKAPKYTSLGKKHRTLVPCNGKERTLLIRTTTGDSSPQVLAWADAFLVVFNMADQKSFEACEGIFGKIAQYRRSTDLPCMLVGIEGLLGEESVIDPDTADTLAEQQPSCLTFVQANPHTGVNVDRLFHDVVHEIVEYVIPVDRAQRVGKMAMRPAIKQHNKRLSVAGYDVSDDYGVGRSIPIKQGQVRKNPQGQSFKGTSHKRWICLSEGALNYYNSLEGYMSNAPGKFIDLAKVTVKVPRKSSKQKQSQTPPTKEKEKERFTFVIVSLDGKQWSFDCKTEEERAEWVAAIEKEIHASLNRQSSAGVKNSASMLESRSYAVLTLDQVAAIRAIPGNDKCADCGAAEPAWASINLCVLLCIECSGVHRNMGVHISRVRSLDLDDWKGDHVKMMLAIGNAMSNGVLEAEIPPHRAKPFPEAQRAEKEQWIRDKYAHRAFIRPGSGAGGAGERFFGLMKRGTTADRLDALVHCSKDDISYRSEGDTGKTALHLACMHGDLMWTQLLIWSDADANLVDNHGYTALYYAKMGGYTQCMDLLTASGCTGIGSGPSGAAGLGSGLATTPPKGASYDYSSEGSPDMSRRHLSSGQGQFHHGHASSSASHPLKSGVSAPELFPPSTSPQLRALASPSTSGGPARASPRGLPFDPFTDHAAHRRGREEAAAQSPTSPQPHAAAATSPQPQRVSSSPRPNPFTPSPSPRAQPAASKTQPDFFSAMTAALHEQPSTAKPDPKKDDNKTFDFFGVDGLDMEDLPNNFV